MAKFIVITKPSSDSTFKYSVRSFDPQAIITPNNSHSRAWLVITTMDPKDLSGLTSVEQVEAIDIQKEKAYTIHQFFDFVQAQNIDVYDTYCKTATPVYSPYSGTHTRDNETNFKVSYTSDSVFLNANPSYLQENLYQQFNTFFQNLSYYGPFALKTGDGKVIQSVEVVGKEVYFLTSPDVP